MNYTQKTTLSRLTILVLACSLAACGGGGGGGSSDSSQSASSQEAGALGVTFTPSAIEVKYAEFQAFNPDTTPIGVRLVAHFTEPPTLPVFPVLVEDQHVVRAGALEVRILGDGTYAAFVAFDPTLAAGTYTGKLTLLLCNDPQCVSRQAASGATIPYTINVTPGVRLTAAVNDGIRVPGNAILDVKEGDSIRLESSVPVQWFTVGTSGGFAQSAYTPGTVSTTWTGIARYGVSTPGSVGLFTIGARSDALGAGSAATFRVTQ